MRQNPRIIAFDGRDPPLACSVYRQLVQVANKAARAAPFLSRIYEFAMDRAAATRFSTCRLSSSGARRETRLSRLRSRTIRT